MTIIRDDLRAGTDVILRDKIVEYLQRIKLNPDMGDIQYVKDKSLDFCRKQAMRSALEQAVDMIATGQDENVINIIREALTVGTTPSIGHEFIGDMESRFVHIVRHACPTGIRELDDRKVMNGGLAKGEIGVWAEYAGGYADMRRQQDAALARLPQKSSEAAPAKPKVSSKTKPTEKKAAKAKLSYKDQYALDTLPGKIEQLEAEMAKLEQALAAPDAFTKDAAKFQTNANRLAARGHRRDHHRLLFLENLQWSMDSA